MLLSILKRLVPSRRIVPVAQAHANDIQAEIRHALVDLLHQGPKPSVALDYEQVAYALAAASSARYLTRRMSKASNLVERADLLGFALENCAVPGLMLEFGVFAGASLRFIAQQCAQEVHGFDSFEGLPEDWTHFQRKGRFSLQGKLPQFAESNVRLHVGWFSDTLPRFLDAHPGPVRLAHIDCDLYSSTATVLEALAPRIVSGTVLLFDEYINYPNWREHEYRAFQEFVKAHQRQYEYIGFASSHHSVAVRML